MRKSHCCNEQILEARLSCRFNFGDLTDRSFHFDPLASREQSFDGTGARSITD
jgi:hypothetical protein